jgi:hypothetical protein
MTEAQRRNHSRRITDLLQRTDQGPVRTDLEAYFGPRAEAFLKTYDKLRSGPNPSRGFVLTWCWPIFLVSFVWLFYRKRYVEGVVLALLPVVSEMVLGFSGGGVLWIVVAIGAKSYYVQIALARVVTADDLGLVGEKRLDYLRRAGGVSVVAGTIAGLVLAGLLAAIAYAFVTARPN